MYIVYRTTYHVTHMYSYIRICIPLHNLCKRKRNKNDLIHVCKKKHEYKFVLSLESYENFTEFRTYEYLFIFGR